jgi:hypothetical protein
MSRVASAGVLPGVGSLKPVFVGIGGAVAGCKSGPSGCAFNAAIGWIGSLGVAALFSAASTALRASSTLSPGALALPWLAC